MLVAIEGIDGAGKSTQAALVADALRGMGWAVLEVAEPGGTPLGNQLRSLVLDQNEPVTDRARMLMLSAASAQLYERTVLPALAEGVMVISDRSYLSTIAYQGPDPLVERVSLWAAHDRKPDLVIELRLAAADRHDRLSPDLDVIESSGDAFYDQVYQRYCSMSEEYAGPWLALDATAEREQLTAAIVEAIKAQVKSHS